MINIKLEKHIDKMKGKNEQRKRKMIVNRLFLYHSKNRINKHEQNGDKEL